MRRQLGPGGLTGCKQHQPVEIIMPQARHHLPLTIPAQIDDRDNANLGHAGEVSGRGAAMLARPPQDARLQSAIPRGIAAIVAEVVDSFEEADAFVHAMSR